MKNELKGASAVTAEKAASAAKSAEKVIAAKAEKAAGKVAAKTEKAAGKVAAKTEKVVEKVAAKTEKAAAKTEKAVEKVAAKTEKAAAKTVEKAEKAAKEVAKRTATRKTAVKENVYLQYMGKEINKEDLLTQVKEIWTKEMGKKASEMKSVTLYLKPEENAAYYVVNDDVTGKLEF